MLEFYFKYRRVIARFRQGALGNEIDHIAADLTNTGYKRDSIKLYLARIARFSAYATGCDCNESKPIPREIVDDYLRARPTIAARWAAQVATGHAERCCPDRFAASAAQTTPDQDGLLLEAYLLHLRLVRGLRPRTCEGLILTARRMLAWCKEHLAGRALSELAAKHVLAMTGDLLAGCRSDGSRSPTTAHTRSFLRYLHWANLGSWVYPGFPKVFSDLGIRSTDSVCSYIPLLLSLFFLSKKIVIVAPQALSAGSGTCAAECGQRVN